jgi:hypothetical protein
VERGPRRVFADYFVEIEILGGERLVGVDDNPLVLAPGRLQRGFCHAASVLIASRNPAGSSKTDYRRILVAGISVHKTELCT